MNTIIKIKQSSPQTARIILQRSVASIHRPTTNSKIPKIIMKIPPTNIGFLPFF
ncbi:MAG: hypothetical protein WCW87_01685 [Candidatus Paceibacterota bacterium]